MVYMRICGLIAASGRTENAALYYGKWVYESTVPFPEAAADVANSVVQDTMIRNYTGRTGPIMRMLGW
jgi:hypothetical protein